MHNKVLSQVQVQASTTSLRRRCSFGAEVDRSQHLKRLRTQQAAGESAIRGKEHRAMEALSLLLPRPCQLWGLNSSLVHSAPVASTQTSQLTHPPPVLCGPGLSSLLSAHWTSLKGGEN